MTRETVLAGTEKDHSPVLKKGRGQGSKSCEDVVRYI